MVEGLSKGIPWQSLLRNVMRHHMPKQPSYRKGGGGTHQPEIFQSSLLSTCSLWADQLCTPVTSVTTHRWRFPNQHSYLSWDVISNCLPASKPVMSKAAHTPLCIICPSCVSHLNSCLYHPCSYLLAEIWHFSCFFPPSHPPHSDYSPSPPKHFYIMPTFVQFIHACIHSFNKYLPSLIMYQALL